MKSDFRPLNLLIIIPFAAIVVFWTCYSNANPKSYFSAPLYSIVTISLGIFVSYYLVQKNTDTRKRSDIAEKLLEQTKGKSAELLGLLHNDNVNEERAFVLKRAINNKIENCCNLKLKQSCKEKLLMCKEEVRKLDRAFDNMKTNMANSQDNSSACKQEIIKSLEDIEYHCDKIIIDLWAM